MRGIEGVGLQFSLDLKWVNGISSRQLHRISSSDKMEFTPLRAHTMQTQDRPLAVPAAGPSYPSRQAAVSRTTGETDVQVSLNLDGTGQCEAHTGIPFLDHMLHQISSHGLIDLEVQATGDIEIDDHHTNEDVGITLGMALHQALGDRKGITRFGHFVAPLDESLVQVALDFSGRPHLSYGLEIPTQRVGTYDTQLVREFFVAVVNHSQMTLHIRQLDGLNSHHIIEATFKAFARAMRMATEVDPRRAHLIPSSKGVI
jgi:imidazoleglycerol-phosphate dehydratase